MIESVQDIDTSLATIAAKALPALSGCSLTFNPEKNVYLTLGYTSAAGNMYFRAIRFSNRLAVYYDLGEGYCYTFLNGITLFCWDGERAKIISRRNWDRDNWTVFTEQFAMNQSIFMLKDYLAGQVKILGGQVSDRQLLDFSRQMIQETQQNRLS